ncbi:uncharacterized protein [Anoplolepis gracilipes]|uniref:uncharacterized protein n=1 Tax=Anoplolepis gracilipes TaxID=354296 RepID=UPI003B9E9F1F
MYKQCSLLQANINHSARAQDLLMQHLAEWNIELAVVAEPYYVPPRNNWKRDTCGSVAIIGRTGQGVLPFSLLDALSVEIRRHPQCPVMVAGDLNAKSTEFPCD